MAQILQRFVLINDALQAAAEVGASVAEVYPALLTMMQAQRSNSTTVLRNADKVITHIRCAYHKRYEPVAPLGTSDEDIAALGLVKFGRKATSAHGYAHACAEGINQQATQKRTSKRELASIMDGILDGSIDRADGSLMRTNSLAVAAIIIDRADGAGYEDAEDAKATWDGVAFEDPEYREED